MPEESAEGIPHARDVLFAGHRQMALEVENVLAGAYKAQFRVMELFTSIIEQVSCDHDPEWRTAGVGLDGRFNVPVEYLEKHCPKCGRVSHGVWKRTSVEGRAFEDG